MTKATAEQILQRLAALGPTLADSARATDMNGVSPEQAAALAETGVFELLIDAAHGGAGGEAADVIEAGRALAQHCAASAWLAVSFADAAALASKMDGAKPAGARVAPAYFAETARIDRDGEGYRVSGVWPAVGGLAFADWILLFGLEGPDGPVCALVRQDEAQVSAYSYFGGLRGLGWRSVQLTDVNLASARVRSAPNDSANLMLGALLGCAEGAYQEYVRATRARVSGVGGHAVAQFTQVQARLAESHAEMKCCRVLYDGVIAQTRSGADADAELDRDRAYIARKAVDAITRLLTQMGAMGLTENNPVQRRFRDVRTLASMPGFGWDRHLVAFGRAELGIAPPAAPATAA